MSNPYDDDVSVFCVTIVRSLVAWNQAEEMARRILLGLSGGGIGAQAAIVHLGNIPLQNALQTAIASIHETVPLAAEKRDHIGHFVKGLDALRPYRNFYIHSLRAFGKIPGEIPMFGGLLMDTEAKGRLAHVSQSVTQADLNAWLSASTNLSRYANVIAAHIDGAAVLANLNASPLASLEKPVWPPVLAKTRTYLGE